MLKQLFVAWILLSVSAIAMSQDRQQLQSDESGAAFFEKRIRPVLREHCLSCHNVTKPSGGLALDHRRGWQRGGDSGAAIVPGNGDDSLLLRVIRHAEPGLEMPAKAPKLDDHTIADIAEWVRLGAPDSRLEPEKLSLNSTRPWNEIRDERATWWSFQPLAKSNAPTVELSASIDQSIDQAIQQAGLQPAGQADRHTLIRRLSYTLRGLPPSPSEIKTFLNDHSPNAWEQCVDRMLNSTSFGERWARHWMDVVRYADTHGSEDDALLPFAYRYRDYLVRAFNADVPFDQLIREHIAGDLITPRMNADGDINESIIGTAFWRFVEFNQSPVDVKHEEVIVIDNQIDALGKAFQALTISCARCHDHKFDPISDEDYYALYGILRSSHAGLRIIDEPAAFTKHHVELQRISRDLKSELANAWLQQAEQWPVQIRAANAWLATNVAADAKPEDVESRLPADAWICTLWAAKQSPEKHPFGRLNKLMQTNAESFSAAFDEAAKAHATSTQDSTTLPSGVRQLFDLREGLNGWVRVGVGLPEHSCQEPGGFAISGGSDNLIGAILEQGYHSNVLSDRHVGILSSPGFIIDDDVISVLARGKGGARLRLVIENFQGDSLLFSSVNPNLDSNTLHWYRMTIRPQWRGLRAHLELITRADKPYVGVIKDPERFESSDGRSSFGIARVVAHLNSITMQDESQLPRALWKADLPASDTMIAALVGVTKDTLTRWQADQCTDNDARWLSCLLEHQLLTPKQADSTPAHAMVKQYQSLENQIPVARRSPGVFEDDSPTDQEFMPRGSHKKMQAKIGRRYLDVLGGKADDTATDSGRRRLADAIANPDNPLTARVYVNRLWHWMFGKGLVATVDNFGRMGQTPTHPELLDTLARQFIEDGWSTKKLIRAMTLSQTWQRDSIPHATANDIDPANRLWSHVQMQRLDAESIYDTLQLVSGNLRQADSGLGTRVFYRSVLDPNKQTPSGPLDGDHRRALFLEVRRNFPNEYLTAFDFPKPSAPAGRRNQTTVPAQSLVLMNDPYSILCAEQWGNRIYAEHANSHARIRQFYLELFGRTPTPDEFRDAAEFVVAASVDSSEADAWTLLAHSLLNLKEAIFLR